MSTDHQRLFDIGRLGGTCDESSKRRITDRNPFIRFMHVMNQIPRLDNQGQVLAQKIYDAMLHLGIVDPDGGILSNRNLTRKNCEVDIRQLMRIIDLIHVHGSRDRCRDQRQRLLRGAELRQCGQLTRDLGFRGHSNEAASDHFEDAGELCDRVKVCDPRTLMFGQHRRLRKVFSDRRQNGIARGHEGQQSPGTTSGVGSAFFGASNIL